MYDGPRTCHPQTRKILPATDNAISLVYRNESGVRDSAENPSANEGDLISPPLVDQQLTSFTPSGPSGFDLPPSAFEELPLAIAPDFGNFLQPGIPPTASTSSDLDLFRGTTPKQRSYEDLCIRSLISSTLFQKPKIPPAPHIPLSFLGESHTRISHTTPELELTLWVFKFDRLMQQCRGVVLILEP